MTSHRNPILRLRAVREAQGRSLRSVAREAEVDPAYLSRVERHLQRPSVELLARVGAVLGLRDLVRTLDLFVEREPTEARSRD